MLDRIFTPSKIRNINIFTDTNRMKSHWVVILRIVRNSYNSKRAKRDGYRRQKPKFLFCKRLFAFPLELMSLEMHGLICFSQAPSCGWIVGLTRFFCIDKANNLRERKIQNLNQLYSALKSFLCPILPAFEGLGIYIHITLPRHFVKLHAMFIQNGLLSFTDILAQTYTAGGGLRGVIATVLDCDIIEIEFKLQSSDCVNFALISLKKGMNFIIPLAVS